VIQVASFWIWDLQRRESGVRCLERPLAEAVGPLLLGRLERVWEALARRVSSFSVSVVFRTSGGKKVRWGLRRAPKAMTACAEPVPEIAR